MFMIDQIDNDIGHQKQFQNQEENNTRNNNDYNWWYGEKGIVNEDDKEWEVSQKNEEKAWAIE